MRDKSSPFIASIRLEANTLREQMQSFALAVAKLCDGTCNALRWHMQCFALAHAMLCVGTCNALRWHMQCFASEMGKAGTEIISPIPDKIKWRKNSPHMAR